MKLSGIIPPMITPLRSRTELDSDGTRRLVDHLIDGGVSGLFLLGTTSEGPSLSYQLRYELVETVCEHVGGRIPVLVGVTDTSLTEALHLCEHASACKATAVVAAAPFYFPVPVAQMEEYFIALADQSPLPVVLYNMPSCTNIEMSMASCHRLAQHQNIVGMKDSSGDLDYFKRLCNELKSDDFSVLIGPEEKLHTAVDLGSDGGVCGGANLFPHLYVQLYRAAVRDDADRVQQLSSLVQRVVEKLYFPDGKHMNIMGALKYCLSQSDICSEQILLPLMPVANKDRDNLRNELLEIDREISRALDTGRVVAHD
ncbi:MAG: dihydrodipicolinate synthase/N-acetylneuraminate lyase [Pirellulaceae bacterium]|jgi:dihydrodipicolinate synthase/N-acetylneuraminate lyase